MRSKTFTELYLKLGLPDRLNTQFSQKVSKGGCFQTLDFLLNKTERILLCAPNCNNKRLGHKG